MFGAAGYLLVYSVKSERSFDLISDLYDFIYKLNRWDRIPSEDALPIVVVATHGEHMFPFPPSINIE